MKIHLNQRLIAQQGLNADDISKIAALHKVKHGLIQRMKRSKKSETLRKLAAEVTEIEYQLQEAWRFSKDKRFHRFFELPGCICPVLDNLERLGTDYMVTVEDCPIHGW